MSQVVVFWAENMPFWHPSFYRDLNGSISLRTTGRWYKALRDAGSFNLSSPLGRQRSTRTKGNIQKIKHRLDRRKPVSLRKTDRHLGISKTSVRIILRNDLGLRAYKIQNEPLLTNKHKEKRVKFANCIRTNFFRKENTMKILFSDEKMFDIDGIYNSQNDQIWAVNRSAADTKGDVGQKTKVSAKGYGLAWSLF